MSMLYSERILSTVHYKLLGISASCHVSIPAILNPSQRTHMRIRPQPRGRQIGQLNVESHVIFIHHFIFSKNVIMFLALSPWINKWLLVKLSSLLLRGSVYSQWQLCVEKSFYSLRARNGHLDNRDWIYQPPLSQNSGLCALAWKGATCENDRQWRSSIACRPWISAILPPPILGIQCSLNTLVSTTVKNIFMNVARNAKIQMRVMHADERRTSLHKVHFNHFTNLLQTTTCNRSTKESITFRKIGVKRMWLYVFQLPRPHHEPCDEVLKNVCGSFFNHWHFKNQLVEPSLTEIPNNVIKIQFPHKSIFNRNNR